MLDATSGTRHGATIGVLSLVLGGEYYGGVVSGIQRAAAEQRGRVVGVRTLQLWQDPILGFEPSRYVPYSWDYIEGFVFILDAVRREDLIAIQGTGKPIVSVSTHYPELGIPAVVPDNRSGVIELVHHLVSHGHQRIAFAGCLGNHDGRERLQA
ncbi:MAG: substrate-binding domain-containing protein, partial [Chloroflexota bacterium]